MNLRSPLSQAQGLGASKTGVHHWWLQRVTSIVLAPLALWLGFSLALLPDMSHQTIAAWISHPLSAVLMLLLIIIACYHFALGMRVIIEDYVHIHWAKIAGIIAVELGSLIIGIVGSLAVLKIVL